MQVIKFSISEPHYNSLKDICIKEEITVKKKINILLAQDTQTINIKDYFPNGHHENPKKVTLKINEELYKGIMKKCGQLDIKVSQYVPYLIYKYLSEAKI
ncbi:MAG: hypothetical protein JW702_08740 [Clostridiales bacterium]|nr:hypothetical protein [Clostridiales bacterium]